ncbi:MAG: transcriptional regulator [Candidatus Competibacteraceae bacterium]
MTVEIKAGSLEDFFASARETAREIDQGKRLTPKNTIWVEPEDLLVLLKPERTKLLRWLRGRRRVAFAELMAAMQRTAGGINRDLRLLARYQLVRVYREKMPDQGICKVIEPLFGDQKLEFRAEV